MGKKNNCHVFEHTSLFTNSTTKTHTHNNKGNKRFCDGHKKFCKHETLYPGYGIWSGKGGRMTLKLYWVEAELQTGNTEHSTGNSEYQRVNNYYNRTNYTHDTTNWKYDRMNSEYNKQHNRHPTEYCTSMKKSHNYMARINGLRRLNCTYRIENNTHKR